LNSLRNAFPGRASTIRYIDLLPWLLIAAAIGLVAMLSVERQFDHDEFEAVKSAWKIFVGERIYIDFFQHHHPLLYYSLTPLFSLFGETKTTLFVARAMMFAFTLGSLVIVHELARRVFSRKVAAVSILFLMSVSLFVEKTIEVRPDVPQTFFGLLSVLLLYRFFDSERRHLLLLSALSLGVGFLFQQRQVVLIALVYAVLAHRVLRGRLRLSLVLQFSAVLMSTWGIYCAYLAYTGELSRYWILNFELNLLTLETRGQRQLGRLASNIAGFNSVVLLGLLLGLPATRTRSQRELALTAIALVAFALLHRVQFAQYYMMALPFVAIIAANGWETIAQRDSVAGAACLVAAFAVAAADYTYDIRYRTNQFQLDRIEYVLENTRPSDYVYDGDIEFNLFRKDPDFFWFSVGRGRGLERYRVLKGYQYDIYEIIAEYKPKMISNFAIEDMKHPVIGDHYREDRVFRGLYLRVD
jgi:4-amino-4-deoxy-L-arabinose transferase-like glycosyltransferase